LAGRCDWRLPSVADLDTTIIVGRCFNVDVDLPAAQRGPCIHPLLGPTSGKYWTATLPSSADTTRAGRIDFAEAQLHDDALASLYGPRLVRSGDAEWPSTAPVGGSSCAAAKVRALGAWRACRLSAQAGALRGMSSDPAACDTALAIARTSADAGAGGSCR